MSHTWLHIEQVFEFSWMDAKSSRGDVALAFDELDEEFGFGDSAAGDEHFGTLQFGARSASAFSFASLSLSSISSLALDLVDSLLSSRTLISGESDFS